MNAGVCFSCGKLYHKIKDCLKRRSGSVNSSINEAQQKKPKTQGRVFAITKQDAHASNAVVSSTLSLFCREATVLFNSSATHSFVSCAFSAYANKPAEPLDLCMTIGTPTGDSMLVEQVFKSCLISVGGRDFLVDLLPLKMRDFDIILRMDWLATNYASIDCFSKEIVFHKPGEKEFRFQGIRNSCDTLTSAIKATKMLTKGCEGFLAFVSSYNSIKASLENIPVVKEFPDRQWLELVKDYDCSINYYPGKANVVAYALKRKSLGSLAHLITTENHILRDLEKCGVMVVTHGQLVRIGDDVRKGAKPDFKLDESDVLWYGKRLCVLDDGEMKKEILSEAHSTAYSVHPDLGDSWEKHLTLIEFSYNNSFHSSIGMPPYEALYGRKCRSPIYWDKVGERRLLGPELIQITVDKIKIIKEHLRAAQSRQRSYADHRRRDLEFKAGDFVSLKVSPWKRVFRFGKKGKLSPGFIGPFEVLERIGTVAYWVALPPNLSRLHNVFHVSVLRNYMADPSHVLNYRPIQISQDMTYEEHPLKILDWKQQVLRSRVFSFVKVHWRNHPIEEATWEREVEMKEKYPQLLETQDT
ncbi:hypothetical protein EZV62_001798 [Acer yangbiense]|uniref:Tf2-1-like SH3-like domain-containing protein n=1 Tax=Acer yangbiense TaxID=1000413 RepID=A0A5C7IVW8_9ROSI|nr:hypothetical protein EZV62_001798 [Acer yangbiense]